MRRLNPLRQMIAVTLAILLGCCTCHATPISETPAAGSTESPAAPVSGAVSLTPSGCWQRLRTTPPVPACMSHSASQVLGTGEKQDIDIVRVNHNLQLAPGSDPTALIVWDAATGQQLRRLIDLNRSAISAAFSPDGSVLAFGALDGTVHLWNVAAGKRLRTLEGHAGPVYDVAFSPDGATLASGSVDGTVILWKAATGRALRTLGGHNSWVISLAFSPDGGTLAAGTSEQAVVLWNVKRGTRRHTLEMPTKHVSHVAFSPDGRTLASASPHGRVTLWYPATGTRQLEIYAGTVGSIAFSPDGEMLAVARPGRVLLLDLATEKQVHELVGYERILYDSVVFADGATVAAGAADGSGALWHITPSAAFCHVWLEVSRPADLSLPAPPARPTRLPAF